MVDVLESIGGQVLVPGILQTFNESYSGKSGLLKRNLITASADPIAPEHVQHTKTRLVHGADCLDVAAQFAALPGVRVDCENAHTRRVYSSILSDSVSYLIIHEGGGDAVPRLFEAFTQVLRP
jgi:hypothetical protein